LRRPPESERAPPSRGAQSQKDSAELQHLDTIDTSKKVQAKRGGRAPKAKGARCELEVARLLQSHGLIATKTPLSGSLGGAYSGDVRLTLLGRELVIECKSRKRFETLHGWLRNRDLLVLRANHQVGLVVLPIGLFAELAAKAEGSR
jgi:hypothetical protein